LPTHLGYHDTFSRCILPVFAAAPHCGKHVVSAMSLKKNLLLKINMPQHSPSVMAGLRPMRADIAEVPFPGAAERNGTEPGIHKKGYDAHVDLKAMRGRVIRLALLG
jgi:hypothetical protein